MSTQEVGEKRKKKKQNNTLVFVTSELLVMGRAQLQMSQVEEGEGEVPESRLGKSRKTP